MRGDLLDRLVAQRAPSGNEQQRPVAGLAIDDEISGSPCFDHSADVAARIAVDVDELRVRKDGAEERDAQRRARGGGEASQWGAGALAGASANFRNHIRRRIFGGQSMRLESAPSRME